MDNFFAGSVMGFREGLEAFLVIAIMLRYVSKIGETTLKKYIWIGTGAGVLASVGFGGILTVIGNAIGSTGRVAKLWESGASLLALILITTFIIWMIKNGSNMVSTVESNVKKNISKVGIILVASTMVAREGVEIAIFTFTGNYGLQSISLGLLISLVLAVLIFFSLVKINLKTIFTLTSAYLILQAGFLLGYSVHEGLSAFKDMGLIAESSVILTKAFNLSSTVFNHKEGVIGLPLYILAGWYSKPEWVQFILQYAYTISIFAFWRRYSNKKTLVNSPVS